MSKVIKRLNNNKIINKNNSMKRDFLFPLIIGIIAGALVMIFLNFGARLNNATNALVQLQQATAQNTTSVNEIVNFINQATGANQETPATPAE
jgi:cell division protein FtsL